MKRKPLIIIVIVPYPFTAIPRKPFSVAQSDIEAGITYSIQKRFKNANATITNNYLNSSIDTTILEMCDYIAQREPIITSYGVLFKRHGTVKNPLGDSIDNFLKLRKVHKKEMFKYPKGSEMFEHFNLLQALDKSILSR